MARGVNKVILIGTLGSNPEVKQLPNGNSVCNLSIATNESWKDKNSGQMQERTEWHKIVAFQRLAEIMGEYLRKGSQVYIEGKLQTRKWTDQNGIDKYTTEIRADKMQMLGGQQGGNNQQQQQQQQQRQAPQQQQQQNNNNQQNQGFDDDIPF